MSRSSMCFVWTSEKTSIISSIKWLFFLYQAHNARYELYILQWLIRTQDEASDRQLTGFAVSVECVWNLMAHGDAREGKRKGNWRMEWVASTVTLPRNVVYPTSLTLMRTPRLPAVDWTDAPADLNGLVRVGERWNLVSARVPSRFKPTILKHARTQTQL